jgi:hypothetical protein
VLPNRVEGCEWRIFDPEVQLSRLLGARQAAFNDALQARLTPAYHFIGLVNLPNGDLLRCHSERPAGKPRRVDSCI